MSKEYYKTKESVSEYIKLAKDVSGLELIEKLKDFCKDYFEILSITSYQEFEKCDSILLIGKKR
jgi:hypothetical protein